MTYSPGVPKSVHEWYMTHFCGWNVIGDPGEVLGICGVHHKHHETEAATDHDFMPLEEYIGAVEFWNIVTEGGS